MVIPTLDALRLELRQARAEVLPVRGGPPLSNHETRRLYAAVESMELCTAEVMLHYKVGV